MDIILKHLIIGYIIVFVNGAACANLTITIYPAILLSGHFAYHYHLTIRLSYSLPTILPFDYFADCL